MKKTYEKPVLMTEQFDVEDVITTSTLDPAHNNFPVDDIPMDITIN